LEELHKQYADKGLVVLGFPSNEFAGQDPGTDEDIASFCQVRGSFATGGTAFYRNLLCYPGMWTYADGS